jgi:O-6-methylguanine DNA methyltransferase
MQVGTRTNLTKKSPAGTRKGQLAAGPPSQPNLAVAVFATELDWMALAYRGDETIHGLVFGHATPRQAVAALGRALDTAVDRFSVDRFSVDRFSVDVVGDDTQLSPTMDRIIDRLCRYAAGELVDFSDVRTDDRHLTTFGRRVRAACRRIPRGQTRTYGQLAAVCGSPGAARAVGQVMARNRHPLVVPCHRVLAAGGGLGGFSAPQGLAMKRRLLTMENARDSASQSV